MQKKKSKNKNKKTKTAELNQSRHFRDVLTLEWKSRNMLYLERGCAFVSRKQRAMVLFKIHED